MSAPATTRRARRPQAPALCFDPRLVLNQWILSLFEEDSFIPSAREGKELYLLRNLSRGRGIGFQGGFKKS